MSLTVKIVAYLLLTFIGCYFYFENFNSYRTIKKALLGLVILAGVSFGVWDIINSYNDSEEDKRLRTKDKSELIKSVDSSLKAHNLSYNPETKTITVVKTPNRQSPFALLGYSPAPSGQTNPKIDTSNKKADPILRFYLTNYGTGKAFDISIVTYFVTLKDGIVYDNGNKYGINNINKSVEIYPSTRETSGFSQSLTNYKRIVDSVFICIGITYTDSTKIKKSLPRILYSNRSLELEESSLMDYNKIEKYLIKHTIWSPRSR